jgi:hypothetical protein
LSARTWGADYGDPHTRRFAQQVAHKFAHNVSTQVREDLAENHRRKVARSCLQSSSDAVRSVAQAKEET